MAVSKIIMREEGHIHGLLLQFSLLPEQTFLGHATLSQHMELNRLYYKLPVSVFLCASVHTLSLLFTRKEMGLQRLSMAFFASIF